jgi:beta-lactamase class A
MASGLTRRSAILATLIGGTALLSATRRGTADDAEARIVELEAKRGGRLGVAVLDTATGRSILHRADDRFALCSTFKLLAAALVLRRVDKGEEQLDRRIVYPVSDLVTYSPETEKHAGPEGGMTIAAICAAALNLSDNTAGNILLASFGGPPALTAFARSLGDNVTRLDRMETALNEARPGDPRDTTSPSAMSADIHRILLGDALSPASRQQMIAWLLANKTGGKRLRAGLPPDWRVGDKTGSGNNGATNDVAILWPPGRAPILAAVYFAESQADAEARNGVIAEVGRIVAGNF